MRRVKHKHEIDESQPKWCVFCLVGVLISAMALGCLRLYGLYLEHQLADVTQRLRNINDRNVVLEERYSALLSPARIYTYARVELNMVMARDTHLIRVEDQQQKLALKKQSDQHIQEASGFYSKYVSPIIVKKANAKD